MRNHFCTTIKCCFTTNPYTEERLNDSLLYAYDDKNQQRTFFTMNADNKDISLKISNNKKDEVVHICIDGGIITYGLEDYVGDGKKRGRCDCMVFNDRKLIFVEFKMNVGFDSVDKTLWKTFSHAMKQIEDFYLHLKAEFQQKGDDLHNYYSETDIIPIICMKHLPIIHPSRNVQRNNEKEKFRSNTHLKIESSTEYSLD